MRVHENQGIEQASTIGLLKGGEKKGKGITREEGEEKKGGSHTSKQVC